MVGASPGPLWLCSAAFLVCIVVWRTVAVPYTKVEESFTIQAVHDILVYGTNEAALAKYDHQVFPGAVPRSFLGPLLLALISYPFVTALRLLGILKSTADVQLVIRLVLGLFNAVMLIYFSHVTFGPYSSPKTKRTSDSQQASSAQSASVSKSVSHATKRKGSSVDASLPPGKQSNHVSLSTATKVEGNTIGALFLLISACQFHYTFWCSRTIPNSVTLPFVVSALALVTRNIDSAAFSRRAYRDYRFSIFRLTFCAVVLRLELVATLIPVGLYLLATRNLTLLQGVATGLLAGFLSIFATTITDTYFWQDLQKVESRSIPLIFVQSIGGLFAGTHRPLWPELEAILFNVVQGKSSEWGVSPWHAYFTASIPKLLVLSSLFVPFGLSKLTRKVRFLLMVALIHTIVLSMLAHKEWRFIIYALPAFNCVAAIGARAVASSRIGLVIVVLVLALQLASSELMVYISGLNYPGGVALSRFHHLLNGSSVEYVNLHIDVLPAMTGVTLFQSTNLDRHATTLAFNEASSWTYDKSESLPVSGPEARTIWAEYTHLLTDQPQCRILQSALGTPLLDAQQLFEPLADPVQSYAGLRRKSLSSTKADLLKLLTRRPPPLGELRQHIFRLVLPVEIVLADAVWLCKRKSNAA